MKSEIIYKMQNPPLGPIENKPNEIKILENELFTKLEAFLNFQKKNFLFAY
jgi:hypothetical protein